MVRVYTAADNFEAQVVAARLGAAGILWQLRADNLDSLYPALGMVEVLVEEANVLEAAALVTPATLTE